MGWIEDLMGFGGIDDSGPSLIDNVISPEFASQAMGSGADIFGWGDLDPLAAMPAVAATGPFNNYAEQFNLMYDDYGPSMSFAQESGPSLWQQASDIYAPIDKALSSPLGKLGVGGLGALVSYYGANKQNQLMKKAMEEAAARRAAALAQHATDTAPVRVTNQRAALPSWSATSPRAFSGNSLAAMTPRSTSTMYAAEGGPARGQGGLCQACGGGAHYVEGGTAGQDDKIPAMLSDGEYVFDADTVAALGDGNNAAGAKKLDKMRVGIRKHKRSAPPTEIPPKAKAPEAYMKGAK